MWLTENREEKIKKSAEEIIDKFSEIEKNLPTEEKTYYLLSSLNVLRSDKKESSEEKRKSFRKNFLRIMPEKDDEGNLKVEVAEWSE